MRELQTWPVQRNLHAIAPVTAASTLALSKTMNGALPPSSIETRFTEPAACRSSIYLITTRLSSLDSFTRRPAAAVSASSQHAYHSVVSTSSRLAAFNSNGPTTSTCKCNINKLKNVRNKMCVKTAINAWLKKLIARLTRLKNLIAQPLYYLAYVPDRFVEIRWTVGLFCVTYLIINMSLSLEQHTSVANVWWIALSMLTIPHVIKMETSTNGFICTNPRICVYIFITFILHILVIKTYMKC